MLKQHNYMIQFPVVLRAGRIKKSNVPFHQHPGTELVLIVEGMCRVEVENQILEGSQGTLFVLPAKVPHNQISNRLHTLCIVFLADNIVFDESPRTIQISENSKICRWIEDLVELYLPGKKATNRSLEGLLLAVTESLRHLEQQDREQSLLHPALENACNYIKNNLTDSLNLSSLARSVHVSNSHLSSLFKNSFGCGAVRYQQNLRMEKARDLLPNPYLSVQSIAERCGYEDSNYFIRLFRQHHGIPPNKWRERHQNQTDKNYFIEYSA
ncbi:MAG: helix-turn-helix transcriptional regulator [SAR324 cluster bacterium]|nr:helix-turn-helix transcriptional regulator [SAR324 cluster bacterium]